MIWLLSIALAAEVIVAREGTTVEALAESLGDPALASDIRELNDIATGAQPNIGQLLTLPEPTVPHQEQDAFVIAARGRVVARDPSGQSREVEIAEALPPGTTVCTDSGAFASVRLAVDLRSGSHDDISLFPETCVRVRSLFSRGNQRSSLVELDQGGVVVRDGGPVTVNTKSGATIGERGGYRVAVEPDAMRTEALTAPVAVQGAGVEIQVGAGQGSRTRTGQAPGDPVDLLGPGTPVLPEPEASLRVAVFQWTEVPIALGYRVEISTSEDFFDLVHVEEVSEARFQPRVLFLPTDVQGYWWRVTSMDRFGFVGLPSDARSLSLPAGVQP